MDSKVVELALERITDKGWLSLANLYFDNDCIIDVFSTEGYVAYSPSKECFFKMSTLDSANTETIKRSYVRHESKYIASEKTILCAGAEHMQHFEIAMYANAFFFNDDQEKMPYPRIPTPEEIAAFEKDEDGKYPEDQFDLIGYNDFSKKGEQRTEQTLALYPREDAEAVAPGVWRYSGAYIDAWKRFYKNQEKFKAMLAEAYGITDAI